ncbi:MAG: glycyl-radical enzyme activating protein [Spirochaetota bacterium]
MSFSVKGTVFDIRRHSLHDGPGIRTSFFVKGCPLNCLWCHNPEGLCFGSELQNRPERCISCGSCGSERMDTEACPTGAIESIARELSVEEALEIALADESFYDVSGGGVTFTGGEPLAQGEFLLEAVREFKKYGLHVCLDTSGFAPEELINDIAPYIDLVLYDLKNMDDQVHRRLTGVSNTRILSNARQLVNLGKTIQFSFPLVPGLTDDDENLQATALFVAELTSLAEGEAAKPSIRILPYHDSARIKYKRKGLEYKCQEVPVPVRSDCDRTAGFFHDHGLTTSIGGL